MFRKGQKVKCIKATSIDRPKNMWRVELGRIYTIAEDGSCLLVEDPTKYGWSESRFELWKGKQRNLPDWF